MVIHPPTRRGALTFRLPVELRTPCGVVLAQLRACAEETKEAVIAAYGVGRYVAPVDQVLCRWLMVDGQPCLEYRITVELTDDGALLQSEIRRRQRVASLLHGLAAGIAH